MSSSRPIGGYFGLEQHLMKNTEGFLHDDAILLNTARNCFEYILRANKVAHVYMPKYTCDVMLEPLQKLNIPYTFYSIDEVLEIVSQIELKDDEYIVYTNYFGVKDEYSRQLSKVYGRRLILDCSQAYYFEPLRIGHTIYSPRKFFGLPDGGCLYTDRTISEELPIDNSDDRMSHLFKRNEEGAEAGYADFQKNDASLIGQPIKQMSPTTKELLSSIDFDQVRQKRVKNFHQLHVALKLRNDTKLDIGSVACPMIYAFKTKNKSLRHTLIDQKIFVATYWPNVFEWCSPEENDYQLAEDIIPLPIDQRYGEVEMQRIIQVVQEYS